MSDRRLFKAWGADCRRTALIFVLAFVFMIAAFIGPAVVAAVLPVDNDQRITIWIGGFLGLFFILLLGIVTWNVRAIGQRAKKLDSAFSTLGLTGSAYLLNGRQYHGTLSRRQADVYFYRGPHLDIYLSADVKTRLGIGLKGHLTGIASQALYRPESDVKDPALAHLGFFGVDERWSRALVDDPRAKQAILDLTKPRSDSEIPSVLLQPDAICLKLHRTALQNITPVNARAWVNDLATLAMSAEALPPTTSPVSSSPMERKARLDRDSISLPILGITCGVAAMLLVSLIVIVLLVVAKGGIGY